MHAVAEEHARGLPRAHVAVRVVLWTPCGELVVHVLAKPNESLAERSAPHSSPGSEAILSPDAGVEGQGRVLDEPAGERVVDRDDLANSVL